MPLRDILATNLRRTRKNASLTQEALAVLAGIDRTYVSALERGKYAATIDMIESLAAALHIESIDLLVDAQQTRRK
jgi:transcriptional regulator with XRE-family HTH domain